MMSENRREDMARRIEIMARYRPFAGASVLEIGADANGFAAQMLIDAGAGRVISSNHHQNWPNDFRGSIERRRVDARRLEDSFAPDSLDVIFGVAVMEHIDGLADFYAGARRVLKPGGLFYVHGGPIWTAAKGHHVHVRGEKAHYRFGDPKSNPVRDWSHLVRDREGLRDELLTREVHPPDAETIAQFVYESGTLNRVGYRSMCDIFGASGFNLIEQLDAAFKGPPEEILAQIERGPWGGQKRYDVSGITFIAKP